MHRLALAAERQLPVKNKRCRDALGKFEVPDEACVEFSDGAAIISIPSRALLDGGAIPREY